MQGVPNVSGGTSRPPDQAKVMLSTTNNLNTSTKFRSTWKWKYCHVKTWIDTAGEIQFFDVILKWSLVVCFYVTGVGFFCKISGNSKEHKYHILAFVFFSPKC